MAVKGKAAVWAAVLVVGLWQWVLRFSVFFFFFLVFWFGYSAALVFSGLGTMGVEVFWWL